MRILLKLELQNSIKNILPVNYQYPLSAWIYKTIHEGDHKFAEFLHNKGFEAGSKSFKFFTFSMLGFDKGGYSINGDRLHILNKKAKLELSFLIPDALQYFIEGLFQNQNFTIGDTKTQVPFIVRTVEVKSLLEFKEDMIFRTLSPLIVSQNVEDSRYAKYLEPEDSNFERIFFDNLVRKYAAALNAELITNNYGSANYDMKLKIMSKPRKKGLTIKAGTREQSKIIGYMFDFRITAPVELIKIGYLAGFGEKNSLGLGCVQTL